ncbi:MAG: hypothetical protein P3W96_010830 [Halomonas sp.]|nr:hypothetical protein [Halomonas sp.]MDM7482484.1 hypothetical protein [Halomonas sp.]
MDLANVIAAFRLEGAEEESSEMARIRVARAGQSASLPSPSASSSAPSKRPLVKARAAEEWETF